MPQRGIVSTCSQYHAVLFYYMANAFFRYIMLSISLTISFHDVAAADSGYAAHLYPAHGRGGGTYVPPPPHRFFADSRKMAARSAAKFGIAVHSSFAHLV